MKCIHVAAIALVGAIVWGSAGGQIRADFQVDVGYADDLRPTPFFPNPWQGSPNTIFAGGGGSFDAGAVKILNTGAFPITVQDLTVDSFENGASFHIWGGFLPQVLTPGMSMIFTQTTTYDFDSSDEPGHDLPASAATPVVHFTVDGVLTSLVDTAQVLNTEGSDHLALNNENESHVWRPIGTFGGQSPEPSSVVLLCLGGLALGAYGWRQRRKTAH